MCIKREVVKYIVVHVKTANNEVEPHELMWRAVYTAFGKKQVAEYNLTLRCHL